MYTLLSGVDTTLRDLPPLRRHVPLSTFYRSVKALDNQRPGVKTINLMMMMMMMMMLTMTTINYPLSKRRVEFICRNS